MAGATPRRADLNRDLPVALIAPLITVGLASDGTISRMDGLILLGCFTAWLAVTVRQAARERDATAGLLGETDRRRITRDAVLGLVLLILAGRLIVLAAQDIGLTLGWDTFTVGAVMVAVGTSTPELATTITARLRGHDEVSVGTVLGSNIFNGLLIVGVAAATPRSTSPAPSCGWPSGAVCCPCFWSYPVGRIGWAAAVGSPCSCSTPPTSSRCSTCTPVETRGPGLSSTSRACHCSWSTADSCSRTPQFPRCAPRARWQHPSMSSVTGGRW